MAQGDFMMDDVTTAIEGVRVGVKLLGESIGLIKQTKDLLPNGTDKTAIEKSLIEAEKAAKLAESQIALALGYKLCQCTFPPQIMLSKGYKKIDEQYIDEEFVCPNCNKSSIAPAQPDMQFDSLWP
ncbi:MAG: hypothetical protein ACI832_002317 [Rheinheimera aquimaris]|jgi:hypothetical protein